MTTSEKTEIVLIVIVTASIFFLTSMLPSKMTTGRLMLNASALLLFQSLVRDLWILYKNKNINSQKLQKQAECMCVESTVGVVGILIGAILLGLGLDHSLTMSSWAWTVLVAIVLSSGFLIKDFVFEWNPWRVYKDKDHMNIVFTRK